MIRSLCGFVLILVSLVGLGIYAQTASSPRIVEVVIGEWPNCTYERYIVGTPKQHGLQEEYAEGRLSREYYCDNGQPVWKKTYYPSGQLHEHVFEGWDFRFTKQVFDEHGELVAVIPQ